MATLRCKGGFQETIPYGVEQYTNARGCHWQCVVQGGSGSGRVFLGKLSPFTTTNSNVDLGCIFHALFVGTACSCYSLGLTTTIIVVVGTHVSLGSLVPPKIQVKGQPMALLYAALFGILLRLLVKMRSMFGKPIPTYSMRFPPLRARGSMGTFLNPIITCTRIYYYVSSWTLQGKLIRWWSNGWSLFGVMMSNFKSTHTNVNRFRKGICIWIWIYRFLHSRVFLQNMKILSSSNLKFGEILMTLSNQHKSCDSVNGILIKAQTWRFILEKWKSMHFSKVEASTIDRVHLTTH